MDLSFSSMFFHDASLEEIIRSSGLTGADSIEFWLETPDFWLKGLNEDYLRALLNRYPCRIPLSIHAPVLDLNPCSINPDVREVSVMWIIRSILFADRISASVCTIHPGRRTAKRPPGSADYLRLDQMLDSVEPVAEKLDIKVAIENMEPGVNSLLSHPREVRKLLESRSWLWLTLDLAHASILGTDTIQAFIDEGYNRIANIHLSSAGKRGMHQPVSYDPGSYAVLNIIKNSGYDGLITLEINDLMLNSVLNYQQKLEFITEEIMYVKNLLQ